VLIHYYIIFQILIKTEFVFGAFGAATAKTVKDLKLRLDLWCSFTRKPINDSCFRRVYKNKKQIVVEYMICNE